MLRRILASSLCLSAALVSALLFTASSAQADAWDCFDYVDQNVHVSRIENVQIVAACEVGESDFNTCYYLVMPPGVPSDVAYEACIRAGW